jgi:hypothetical protein
VKGVRRRHRQPARTALVVAATGAIALTAAVVPLHTGSAAAQSTAAEAVVASAEETYVQDVVTLLGLRSAAAGPTTHPYEIRIGNITTVVLQRRTAPYTLGDLLALPDHAVVAQGSGTYLLRDNVFVEPGATLLIAAPSAPVDLRMLSAPSGFTSIVSYGGVLDLYGSPSSSLSVTSWDPGDGQPDSRTDDGRAYIRSISGSVSVDNVKLAELGFGDGATSGMAVGGADPHMRAPSILIRNGSGGHEDSYQPPVAASVRDTSSVGNAVGLYLASVSNPVVADSAFSQSLYSGLYLGHFVTGALIEDDQSSHNHRDGFELASAVIGSRLLSDQASNNGMSGFALDGQPLRAGDPAAQTAALSGNDSISHCRAIANGVSGIAVHGGEAIDIAANFVSRTPVGIAVQGAAQNVIVGSNQIQDVGERGITLTDGVAGAVLDSNTITAAATGIYMRASSAVVSHNSIRQTHLHGISLVALTGVSRIGHNVVSGSGRTALDIRTPKASVSLSSNDTSAWVHVKGALRRSGRINPVTLAWLGLFLVAVVMTLAKRQRKSAAAVLAPIGWDTTRIRPEPELAGSVSS